MKLTSRGCLLRLRDGGGLRANSSTLADCSPNACHSGYRERDSEDSCKFTLLASLPRILGISAHSMVYPVDAAFARRNWRRRNSRVGDRHPFLFPDRPLAHFPLVLDHSSA